MQILLFLLWFVATAAATPYNVKFCTEVDIDLDGDGAGGDYWTNDDDDKPARGFEYQLIRIFPDPDTVVDTDYMVDHGTDVGCTATYSLSSNNIYQLTVTSEASVAGNTIQAFDDDTTPDEITTVVVTAYTPAASETKWTNVLSGSTDTRWNHLALVAWAMYFEHANLTGLTLPMYDTMCCSGGTNGIHVGSSDNKFQVVHEAGHFVSAHLTSGWHKDTDADVENCDGSGMISSSGTDMLTKEFTSAAIVEGMACWYAAEAWNDIGLGATTCEYTGAPADFDLNEANDYGAGVPFPCTGDRNVFVAWVDSEDWLEDVVTNDDDAGAAECDGVLENRSSIYDFMRYAIAMRSVEGVYAMDIWNIWDDADPTTWNKGDTGDTGDAPQARWTQSASANGLATEHANQASHGLDH